MCDVFPAWILPDPLFCCTRHRIFLISINVTLRQFSNNKANSRTVVIWPLVKLTTKVVQLQNSHFCPSANQHSPSGAQVARGKTRQAQYQPDLEACCYPSLTCVCYCYRGTLSSVTSENTGESPGKSDCHYSAGTTEPGHGCMHLTSQHNCSHFSSS